MEKESEDFPFDSEESSKKQPIIIRIKKTYTEECSIDLKCENWHHFKSYRPEGSYCSTEKMENDATMQTSQCKIEPQLSYRAMSPATDENAQVAIMPRLARDNQLPKLSVLFPNMFAHEVRPDGTRSHDANMLSNSYQFFQLQKHHSVETASNKFVAEIVGHDVNNENSQLVPVLDFPAKETATKSKSSESTDFSSMNMPLMSKNHTHTIQRKLLNRDIKGPSPWPEMSINADIMYKSQEFDTEYNIKNLESEEDDENKPLVTAVNWEKLSNLSSNSEITLEAKDIALNAIGNTANISQLDFSIGSDHSQMDLTSNVTSTYPPLSWISGTSSNPLQIPWSEIMNEIAFDEEGKWLNQSLNISSMDFLADFAAHLEKPNLMTNDQENIETVPNEAQVVPQSNMKSIQEPRLKKIVDNIECGIFPISNAEFVDCPEIFQEVVLTMDNSGPEAEDLQEHTYDLLNILENHNYCRPTNSVDVVPLSSSPWTVDHFNMSIAELHQKCSPIDKPLPKSEQNTENMMLLENQQETVNDFAEDMDLENREEATDGHSHHEIAKDEEDAQICPGEVQPESISGFKDSESTAIEEQTVPNSSILMTSAPLTSACAHRFEFEEFYANSTTKKRAKTSRVDGSNHLPLRIGLSKKRRVTPLHDLKNITRE